MSVSPWAPSPAKLLPRPIQQRGVTFGQTTLSDDILTQDERMFARHAPSVQATFVRESLKQVGTGPAGLSVEDRTHIFTTRFPHKMIAQRDAQGKPYAFIMAVKDPTQDRYVLLSIGMDAEVKANNRPLAKQSLIAMMKALDALGQNWIVGEPSSPEARRFVLRYLRHEGRSPHRPGEIFYEGREDKTSGTWIPVRSL